MYNYGVIGLGKIANKFLDTLNKLNLNVEAVASNSYERALSYKEKYNSKKAYGSYEELLDDENVDIVYIATPHGLHYKHLLMCLNKGKHVICEKAFTINYKQAEEVLNLAKEKKLLVMEAMWTRFLPAIKKLEEIVKSNKYGKVISMDAVFSFEGDLDVNKRLGNKELGGGALLDIGIYTLTLANIILGAPSSIKAIGNLSKEGVDLTSKYLYENKDGILATLEASIEKEKGRFGRILLDNAYIDLPAFWALEKFSIYDYNDNLIEEINLPFQINGFEYQILSFEETLKNGKIENEIMPHSKTLEMLELMDTINDQLHLKF